MRGTAGPLGTGFFYLYTAKWALKTPGQDSYHMVCILDLIPNLRLFTPYPYADTYPYYTTFFSKKKKKIHDPDPPSLPSSMPL